MGFFQNLKDDLTSTIDDIAIKEEQGLHHQIHSRFLTYLSQKNL